MHVFAIVNILHIPCCAYVNLALCEYSSIHSILSIRITVRTCPLACSVCSRTPVHCVLSSFSRVRVTATVRNSRVLSFAVTVRQLSAINQPTFSIYSARTQTTLRPNNSELSEFVNAFHVTFVSHLVSYPQSYAQSKVCTSPLVPRIVPPARSPMYPAPPIWGTERRLSDFHGVPRVIVPGRHKSVSDWRTRPLKGI